MKVECPNCQTTYNLPDEKVGPDGADVRCSVCKHVFHVGHPSEEDFPGFGESGAAPGWPVDEDMEVPGGSGRPLDERKADPFDKPGVSSSEFTSIDFGVPEKKSKGIPSKNVILATVLGIVVALGLGGTAAYFFELWPFAKTPPPSAMEDGGKTSGEGLFNFWPFARKAPPSEEAKAPTANAPERPDYLSQIQIASHEYYFVDNDKIGKLFVISGKLVNKSQLLVRDIEMEASIMDGQDKALDTIVFKAGPKASNFELKTLSREDLEARLTSKQEIMLYNGEVKTGDEVPFMVAFINPSEALRNYSLKIRTLAKVVASEEKK